MCFVELPDCMQVVKKKQIKKLALQKPIHVFLTDELFDHRIEPEIPKLSLRL